MENAVQMIKECLQNGGDLCDTLNTIWLQQEEEGTDLSYPELNALVLQAIREMK